MPGLVWAIPGWMGRADRVVAIAAPDRNNPDNKRPDIENRLERFADISLQLLKQM